MLKLLLVSVLGLETILSLVRDPSYRPDLVKSRQYHSDNISWYHFKWEQVPGDTSDKYITYSIDAKFPQRRKKYIRDQFKKITSKTCMKTLEIPFDGTCADYIDCINILKKREPHVCRADRDTKEINLSKHCFDDKWVIHEILHVMGFGHEHSRPDRDCYVQVTGNGVFDSEYDKKDDIDISFPYDVHSVMHYRVSSKLKPASFALVQDDEFGRWDELTEMDVIALNYMYCGGKHYCDINPVRCQYFRCWIECNPCSNESIRTCKNCDGNTYG